MGGPRDGDVILPEEVFRIDLPIGNEVTGDNMVISPCEIKDRRGVGSNEGNFSFSVEEVEMLVL